jgi:transposase
VTVESTLEDRLKRHDLSEEEWQRLELLLPSTVPQRGGRWADHRMVINGVFFRARSGTAWRDLPPVYGNWKTVYNRHRRWSLDGTWENILDRLRVGCDEAEGADWTVKRVSIIQAWKCSIWARVTSVGSWAASFASGSGECSARYSASWRAASR